MAVNINTVYQRVLALANKEQRGYITPLEFNLLANQAQMEIFEQYFYDINLYNRAPGNSTEYADMLHILEEKISFFKKNDQALTSTALYTDDFELDITGWTIDNGANGSATHVAPAASNNYNGGLKIMQTANATAVFATDNAVAGLVAGKKYKVSWTVIDFSTAGSPALANSEVGGYRVSLIVAGAATEIAYEAFDISNGSFDFTFIADNTSNYNLRIHIDETQNDNNYITFGEIKLEEVDNTTIGDGGTNPVYRLGEVMWQRSGQNYATQVPLVNANEITKYNVSPLARPTSSNPVYVRISDTSIKLYPTPTSTDTITHNFITRPVEVYWGYTVVPNSSGGNEYPMYNASTSQNFELHESEEMPLVYKILELAGIVINKPGLVQAASLEQQENLQQEKQ